MFSRTPYLQQFTHHALAVPFNRSPSWNSKPSRTHTASNASPPAMHLHYLPINHPSIHVGTQLVVYRPALYHSSRHARVHTHPFHSISSGAMHLLVLQSEHPPIHSKLSPNISWAHMHLLSAIGLARHPARLAFILLSSIQ